jgi:hypothetical protein
MPPNGRGGGFNQQWVSAVVLSLVPQVTIVCMLSNRISCFIYKKFIHIFLFISLSLSSLSSL